MSKKNRNRIEQLGKDTYERKGPASTSSVLTIMFQTMARDFGLWATYKWDQCMNQYVNDARNSIPRNLKDQATARGNLQKELLKEEMSWKVFCKGLRFLGVVKFQFKIIATHANGKETEHSHTVNLGNAVTLPPIHKNNVPVYRNNKSE